jgi:uncharacterized protein YpiB (UPF0302 family)
MTKTKNDIEVKERELVIARLEVVSSELCFSSGNNKTITRDEAIEHIRAGDEIGKEFVKVELEFLRALKNGELMKRLIAQ